MGKRKRKRKQGCEPRGGGEQKAKWMADRVVRRYSVKNNEFLGEDSDGVAISEFERLEGLGVRSQVYLWMLPILECAVQVAGELESAWYGGCAIQVAEAAIDNAKEKVARQCDLDRKVFVNCEKLTTVTLELVGLPLWAVYSAFAAGASQINDSARMLRLYQSGLFALQLDDLECPELARRIRANALMHEDSSPTVKPPFWDWEEYRDRVLSWIPSAQSGGTEPAERAE